MVCRSLTLLLEDVSVVRGLSLPKLGGRTISPWVQVGVRSHPPSIVNQNSPIKPTAPPNPLILGMPSSAGCKSKQASNLLPLHQPQEISVICLTKMLSCLWECSDGASACRAHAGALAREPMQDPRSSVPRTSTAAYQAKFGYCCVSSSAVSRAGCKVF